ncbi:MAG TPA: 30S ribosomal protein S27e [Candidatus Nanoarchaeia archaeon]|nr:30S ribosomal protein S27e [Candidatus Nanoarchaeia archaeon]
MKYEPTSSFMKIRCPKCKNEQIIFEKATSVVSCLVCSNVLAEPMGGKAQLKTRALEKLN